MGRKRLWICVSVFTVATIVGLNVLYRQPAPPQAVSVTSPAPFSAKQSEISVVTDQPGKEPQLSEAETQILAQRTPGSSTEEPLSDVDIEQRLAGQPTSVDYKEHHEHLRSRGQTVPEETLQAYATYSTEVLEELVYEGDFAAMDVLEKRYGISTPRDYDTLNELREKAAMFGATLAPMSLGHFHLDEAKYIPKSEEATRNSVVTGLAWLEFTLMRGELLVEEEIKKALKDTDLQITDADVKAAKAEAKRIYQRMADQREARGLPEFDDEVSEGAAMIYDLRIHGPSLH